MIDEVTQVRGQRQPVLIDKPEDGRRGERLADAGDAKVIPQMQRGAGGEIARSGAQSRRL